MTKRQSELFPELPSDKKYVSDYPELVAEWHPTKNGDKHPDDYTHGSNQKVWWKCNHGHEYKTEVHRRINGGGCRKCFNANRSELMRPKASSEDNLAVKNPTLCLEWDYKKNKKPPEYYLPGSGAVVWWTCKNGDDHKWKARINSRADIDDAILNGCPFCVGRKPSALHNLEQNYPNVALEWNYKLNNKLPNQYTPSSNTKVWWICEKGHEWEATINNRTAGRNCPTCSNKSSRNEIRILTECKALFGEVLSRYKFGEYEVDIFIPELNVAVEYDGWYWHRNSYDKDIKKQNKLNEKGVKLLRVREEPLPKITEFDIFVDGAKPLVKSDLDKILNSICSDKEILTSYSIAKGFINEQDYKTYLDYFPNPFPEDSLAKKSPKIAREWHPTKNSPLTPLNFSPGSGISVWWRCEKGHEWKATINNRSKGGCPYCAGRHATNETCMAATHPHLVKIFNHEKNGSLTPQNTKAHSGKKFWWKCTEYPEHQWQSAIMSRSNPLALCPYCSGIKVTNENCMAATHPDLASVFHPSRNGSHTVYNLKAGTGRKIWWQCSKGHEWLQTGSNMIKPSRKNLCKYCRKEKPSK